MNELEEGKISTLLVRYCLPAMAGSLVTALYSIVDQIFIGSAAGVYGNAASNVVWPLVIFLTALSLMCGVGVSACMNMAMGRQDTVSARRYTAGGISLMVLCGLLLSLGVLIFLKPLLYLCGCTDSVFPYASVYTRILAYGFVFSLISSAGPFILRADGVPGYALFCTVIGNVLNVLGDYILVFVLKKGIAGAAWSTVISELTGTVLVLAWLPRMKTMRLEKNDFMLRPLYLRNIASAGMGPAMNFLTQTLSFILINGALKTYGAASVYGSENVLAAAGVANKVNTFASAIVTGLTNGMQPGISYNYGKGHMERVCELGNAVIRLVLAAGFVITFIYQVFPVQIASLFGDGSPLYFAFAARYFRIHFALISLYGLQSSVGGFFSAQRKPLYSMCISMTRQLILLPLLLFILPRFFGIDGVLYSGPLADLGMACVALSLFKKRV
ncbi:MAG: MATE family efflux transporter [Solobacterium sp.]|nr:MATE family efflux transporter [Solobacterium sp.]